MPPAPLPTIISIGDRVGPGTYTLHSRFRRAANYIRASRIVTTAAVEVGAGPANILIEPYPDKPPLSLRISLGRVEAGEKTIRFPTGRRYSSRPELSRPDRAGLDRRLAVLRGAILELAPTLSLAFLLDRRREIGLRGGFQKLFAARIKNGAALLLAGEIDKGVVALRGRGFGLTPSGDDFLAGVLIGLHLRQAIGRRDCSRSRDRIFDRARRGSPMTDHFLALAHDLRLPARLKDLAEAIAGGTEPAAAERAAEWLRSGAGSPADLATGLYATLKEGERICS